MTQPITLSSIFDKTKGELVSSLSNLMLPKDSVQVQQIITDYLNNVCDENSDYRQNLTQSEDYILQAALSMLNAQRDMVSALNHTPNSEEQHTNIEPSINETATVLQGPTGLGTASLSSTSGYTIIGAGGGALVGKLIFGGWGAVFGAIAGNAVALYLSQQSQSSVQEKKRIASISTVAPVKVCDTPVNTELLLNVIQQICDSLDNLIATFRAQIQRVVTKYESQQAPSLEDDYIDLLEKIQALIGASAMSKENDSKSKRIEQRIQLLEECLENYNLKVVIYNGQNDQLFIFQPSTNVTDTVMVLPAITKNESIVIKGKVFTKQ